MRDQASASGAEARLRAAPELSHSRAITSIAAANSADQILDSTVIAPDPGLWRRWRDADAGPVGGALKRSFDVCVAASALVVLAPLLALIWLAIRIDRGGDPIFRQDRGGLGGRTFSIYKFRTMVCAENGADVRQVRAGDTRITKLGHFLRETSWDELPQLFNVLRGDMSLIGPRPHALQHDTAFAAIDTSYPMRFRARPGITGLAQVSGCRGPTETDEHVKMRTAFDVRYVSNWSFSGDLAVLMRTLLLFVKRDPRAI